MMMMISINAYLLFGLETAQLSESPHWPIGKSDESRLGQGEKSSAHQPPAVWM